MVSKKRDVGRGLGLGAALAAAAVLLLAVGVGLLLLSGDSAPEEQSLLARVQGLVRGGDGRGAVRALLGSGGGGGLGSEPTDAALRRAVAAADGGEWQLYLLGAALLREHSGEKEAVKLAMALLKHGAEGGGSAATAALEVMEGAQHRVMANTAPCKQRAEGCRPFSTLPAPPRPGEHTRIRRAVGGWLGERLDGAALGATARGTGQSERMQARLLSREPFVATVDGFLSPEVTPHHPIVA